MVSLFVINASGEKEPFSSKKVYRSTRRAGASREVAQRITETIKREVYPNITTLEIFRRIKALLHRKAPKSALRFSIKEGIRKLGPTGFPFEKYIAEVLKSLGYKVRINQFLPGRCIKNYEIDFVAEKGKTVYVGECKYRHLSGERVRSSDALMNYARFMDITKGRYFKSKKRQGFAIKTMMITNTKFTNRTVRYARCIGFELLGWSYPRNRGLESLIETEKLYPITILPSFKGYLKEIFVQKRKMLACDLLNTPANKLAQILGVRQKEIEKLAREARILLE